MHKKFEINRKKIKGGCQSGRKVVTHNSKSDLPLVGLGAVVSLMVLLVVLLLLLSMFKLCVASYNITEIAALELTYKG